MPELRHVMQRASRKLPGETVELAFPATPVRSAPNALHQTWTALLPVDVAITAAVGGTWAVRKFRRRRAMVGVEEATVHAITVPVILALTSHDVVVLDTGPIRLTWPRRELVRLPKPSAEVIYQQTATPVDTRFVLNGREWQVHGRYRDSIRSLVKESSWSGIIELR